MSAYPRLTPRPCWPPATPARAPPPVRWLPDPGEARGRCPARNGRTTTISTGWWGCTTRETACPAWGWVFLCSLRVCFRPTSYSCGLLTIFALFAIPNVTKYSRIRFQWTSNGQKIKCLFTTYALTFIWINSKNKWFIYKFISILYIKVYNCI